MADSNQSSPSPTSGLSSPAPSGTPTSAPAPAPSPPSPWRAGPNAPAWARDKTADEILGIANQLVEGLGRPSAPAPSPAPANLPPAAPPGYVDPTAYVTGQDLNNAVQAAANQFTPALQRLADQNA